MGQGARQVKGAVELLTYIKKKTSLLRGSTPRYLFFSKFVSIYLPHLNSNQPDHPPTIYIFYSFFFFFFVSTDIRQGVEEQHNLFESVTFSADKLHNRRFAFPSAE